MTAVTNNLREQQNISETGARILFQRVCSSTQLIHVQITVNICGFL